MMRRLGLLFFADFTAMESFSVAVNNLFSSGHHPQSFADSLILFKGY